jgi:hypothetical protein
MEPIREVIERNFGNAKDFKKPPSLEEEVFNEFRKFFEMNTELKKFSNLFKLVKFEKGEVFISIPDQLAVQKVTVLKNKIISSINLVLKRQVVSNIKILK